MSVVSFLVSTAFLSLEADLFTNRLLQSVNVKWCWQQALTTQHHSCTCSVYWFPWALEMLSTLSSSLSQFLFQQHPSIHWEPSSCTEVVELPSCHNCLSLSYSEGCLSGCLCNSQGADLNVQIPRQAEWKSHNIWLTWIICFHKQVGFEDLSRTANDFGNYLREIITDFKGGCSNRDKGGYKVTYCSNPPWRLGRKTSKGAGFIDAISINRISGDSRGKLPQTRDISLWRSENNGCIHYPGTDNFCMHHHLGERLMLSFGPSPTRGCGRVLLLRIRDCELCCRPLLLLKHPDPGDKGVSLGTVTVLFPALGRLPSPLLLSAPLRGCKGWALSGTAVILVIVL